MNQIKIIKNCLLKPPEPSETSNPTTRTTTIRTTTTNTTRTTTTITTTTSTTKTAFTTTTSSGSSDTSNPQSSKIPYFPRKSTYNRTTTTTKTTLTTNKNYQIQVSDYLALIMFYNSTMAIKNVIEMNNELFGKIVLQKCSIVSAFSDNSDLGNYLSQNEFDTIVENCVSSNVTIEDLKYILYRLNNTEYNINTGKFIDNSINLNLVRHYSDQYITAVKYAQT